MALTPEQIIQIKDQLMNQVANLPEEKKNDAISEIEALSPEEMEKLIIQSNKTSKPNEKEKTIFRMIVDRDIPSIIISENKSAIAVLDINPISRGHIIIIPKIPINDAKQIPTTAFTLTKKLAKRIIKKLKAKSSEIQTENKFGEIIINLIPCYNAYLNILSPRSKSSMEELEKIGALIKDRPKPKVQKIKIENKKSSENQSLSIKRRIP